MAGTEEVRIGSLVLQPDRQLLRDGERVALGSKALSLVTVLAAAKGELVTKDELMDAVWPGLIVEENSIQVHIAALRKALGLEAARLLTVRGLGYRFLIDDLPALPLPTKPSVAVLPFANLSQGVDEDYFADGMVVEIVSALSRFQSLFVISSGSTLSYRGDTRGPAAIARELGVRYLLQGTVRKAGNQVRIAVELLDERALSPIWMQRFDGSLDDIFALQDEVSHAVASQIEPSITASEVRRAAMQPTQSNSAYDLYLRGTQAYREVWTRDALSRAADYFERAAALDPSFALAQAYASNVLISCVLQGHADDPPAMMRKSADYARAGLHVGPDDAEVLSLAAYTLFHCDEPLANVDDLIERSLSLNPGMSRCHYTAGFVNLYACRSDAALAAYDMAIRLDPRTPWRDAIMIGRAQALFQQHRYAEALPILVHEEAAFPQIACAIRRVIAICHFRLGDIASACAVPGVLEPIRPIEEFLIGRYRDPGSRQDIYDGVAQLLACKAA